MKTRFGILLFVACAMVSAEMALPLPHDTAFAYADEHDDAREALRRGDILPYSSIKRIVEGQVNGKVVGQKLRRTNRGWQYDLRVRSKGGRVMVLVVNARNGAILSKR